MDICKNDNVVLYGDNKAVIDLLKEGRPGNDLKILYYKVQSLIYEYCRQGNNVYFIYLNEKDNVYRKIDLLSKISGRFVESVLEDKYFIYSKKSKFKKSLPF